LLLENPMKSLTFLCFASLLLSGCYQQERKCLEFRTGTFQSQAYLNGKLITSTSVRNDSIEIDYFMGKSDTSSIRWINECEYIGTKLHPKSMADEKAIHIKILTTDKDTYTFEYGLVGTTKNKKKGTAKKIK